MRIPASVAIIEVRDATGAVVFTYAGDALAGFSPPTLWQAGDLVADSIEIPLPVQGAHSIHVGLQRVFADGPMIATGADGAEYPDGMLPVGEFVISDSGTISAGSGP